VFHEFRGCLAAVSRGLTADSHCESVQGTHRG
jgi:hypothetical protein